MRECTSRSSLHGVRKELSANAPRSAIASRWCRSGIRESVDTEKRRSWRSWISRHLSLFLFFLSLIFRSSLGRQWRVGVHVSHRTDKMKWSWRLEFLCSYQEIHFVIACDVRSMPEEGIRYIHLVSSVYSSGNPGSILAAPVLQNASALYTLPISSSFRLVMRLNDSISANACFSLFVF